MAHVVVEPAILGEELHGVVRREVVRVGVDELCHTMQTFHRRGKSLDIGVRTFHSIPQSDDRLRPFVQCDREPYRIQ